MCGIAGILNRENQAIDPETLRRATHRLRHRGPDDSGYYFAHLRNGEAAFAHDADTLPEKKSASAEVGRMRGYSMAFGFRRLSIQDLSVAAHQPMSTPDRRYTLVFNGEIYNFIELREELKAAGRTFRSHSDTEVLLAAYAVWGSDCLRRFNGMWAFAIWDDRDKTLFAARDRFGVKPFYYAWDGKRFIFASEPAALGEWMALEADNETVSAFLAHDRLNDSAKTFYGGIRELRGSHCLTLRAEGEPVVSRYYRVPLDRPMPADPVGAFREIFLDAVRLRMRSDVPLGYALSGGMDSSSVVVAANRFAGPDPSFQNVFSTVYPGRTEDESFFIDEVVKKTNFVSHRVTPDAAGFLRDVDAFVECHQEPLNNLTYYAQYKLRELEKAAGVTVSLDGHGADELLGGYDQELPSWIAAIAKSKGSLTGWRAARQAAAYRGSSAADAGMWTALAILGPERAERLFRVRREAVRDYLEPAVFRKAGPSLFGDAEDTKGAGPFEQKLHRDLTASLIPHQLLRADKSSMAFSLECRFPFLDYRLVELAFSLSPETKMRDGVSKWVMREAMRRDLPESVYNRRDKKGFPVPERSWLKGELRAWVDSWVYSDAMKRLPWIRWKKFEAHYRRFRDSKNADAWGRQLWTVLSVALWRAKCIEGRKLA